jgi:uncharacterized protein YceK
VRALASIVAVVALLSGCAAVIPHATPVHAQRSGVALETLEHGRGLFVSHCGSCHYAPDPRSRDGRQWALLLPEMLADSKLNPDQATEVLAFLQALSAN